MFRFTIRDVLWLLAGCGGSVCLGNRIQQYTITAEQAKDRCPKATGR